MILDRSTREFLELTASGDSTPGGGAVAALVGALGAALGSMSCHYTLGPAKFRDREDSIRALLERIETERRCLSRLVQEDMTAYEAFTSAMKLPKQTPEEATARKTAMGAALVGAMEVPLECTRRCAEVLRLLVELAPIANPRLLSDVGCAAVLTEAAYQAARFNVLVNLAGFERGAAREHASRTLEELDRSIVGRREAIVAAVEGGLRAE